MKRQVLSACLAIALPAAHAATLDFGGGPTPPAICAAATSGLGGMTTCGDGSFVNQAYGDVAGQVDVSYMQPLATTPSSLRWWATGYNDLYGVLWADGGDGPNSYARVELKALGGTTLTLNQFDLGAYPYTSRGTELRVFEIGSNVALFSYLGSVGTGSSAHNTFSPNLSSSVGFWIDYRNSAYNVGLDNLVFTTSAQAVPEPSSAALMFGGLLAVGALTRRRRQA